MVCVLVLLELFGLSQHERQSRQAGTERIGLDVEATLTVRNHIKERCGTGSRGKGRYDASIEDALFASNGARCYGISNGSGYMNSFWKFTFSHFGKSLFNFRDFRLARSRNFIFHILNN